MLSRMTLDDRTAVITGAGSGIGRAIAQALARRGCHLALVDISEPGLAETVQLVDGASIRSPGRSTKSARPISTGCLRSISPRWCA
jgi:NAD(P)-dependent dehydrogenase (short-subunit alcohol dehydrogenase family)